MLKESKPLAMALIIVTQRAAPEDPKHMSLGSTLSVVAPILNTSMPNHLSNWLKSSMARRLAPFKVALILESHMVIASK